MSDLEMWALVCGFFLPLGIAVVEQAKWSNTVRAIVAFVMCAAAGAVTAAVGGELTGKTWISTSLIVLIAAIATYHAWWKKTGIAPKVENLTNI
jgi:hypothetical protein